MIRNATIDDFDDLFLLYKKGFKLHYDVRKDIFKYRSDVELKSFLLNRFNDKDEEIILLEEENIKGYLSYHIKETVLQVDELVVSDERKGYGRLLIEEIKNKATNNVKRIELTCYSFNENAIKFYEKLDFKEQKKIYELKLER